MTDYIKNAADRAKKLKARRKKRVELVGEDAVIKQDSRNFNKKVKGAFTKGDTAERAAGREAVKRVGEYRKGKFSKMAAGGITTAPPVNTANMSVPTRGMKKGGICKGMGAATRGGKFGRNG
jgi:hypothetical protein